MKNRVLKCIFALSVIFSFSVALASPQEIVQLADYISVDYPDAIKDGVIINDIEYKEMEEFSKRVNQLGAELNLDPAIIQNMQELNNLIAQKVQPSVVATKARAISLAVSQKFNLIKPPKSAPDLAKAKVLYQQNCASCHGAAGKGDGVLAAQQEPAPTNFQDLERAKLRNINGLYNTITMGVEETGMAPYEQQLTDDERWALALYVGQMFATDEQVARGKMEWQNVADKSAFTPERLVSRTLGEEVSAGQSLDLIAYLRQNPQEVWLDQKNLWSLTQRLLDDSFKALQAGDAKKAYQLALSAYLDGFELLEPVIATLDSSKLQELEIMMLTYRSAVQNNDKISAEKILQALTAELSQVQIEVTENESHFSAVFASALIILLREGMEIILVLAVMFVLVKRMEQNKAIPYIHAGWISAVVAGLGLWFISHQFITISGANREITEGVLALIAAVILFYVGFWIHRQTSSQKWQQTLQSQLNKQLAKSSLIGLSFIAFIAVFREMLEIALFYETLWLQTHAQQSSAIVGGIVTALILLLALSFAVNKLSIRLPINKFFAASSIVIIVLSVIFLGSGLQALAEAGRFPIRVVNIPQIELLGIYPNLWVLLCQLALVLMGGYVWYKQRRVG